jgi:ribosomal protein S18 acetylase RimI-like enzyme
VSDSELEGKSDKLREKRKTKYTFYQFTPDHPLHSSHHIKLSPDNENIVVNFIGGNLLWCDQGDREYYCSAMLALFKPWWTGKELKSTTENWDTAFANHNYNTDQLSLIKNANIRYECLDAKDDYHAQMQKNAGVLPVWEENNHLKTLSTILCIM